ncbi:MAG: Proposed peptidoglycan lipid II flippase MurJ, partial [uncultured Nocardioidaceae bacterium]
DLKLGADLERGDGGRDRGVPGERLRAIDTARGCAGDPAARRRLHDRQHRPEHALHPAGRRRLQRRARPSARPGDAERQRPRRGLHQPGDHSCRAVPGGGHRGPGPRSSAADAALPRRLLLHPRARRPAGIGGGLRPVLPAAGLLLRHVRADRTGAQRPRPLRSDDVGADRQQRHLGRRSPRLPPRVRSGLRCRAVRRVLRGRGVAARPRRDGRDRRPVRGPCPLPPVDRFQVPSAVRLPRQWPRAHPPARSVDGRVRRRQPDRLHRRRTTRLERHRGRRQRVRQRRGAGRHRLHRLRRGLPARDGPALGGDGVAGDRRATPTVPVCRRWRPGRAGAAGGRHRADRPGLHRAVRDAAARDRAAVVQRGVGLRGGQRDLLRLRAVAGDLRSRAGGLHRPLPHAARLLRLGAHPHGVLGAVRDRRDQHRPGRAGDEQRRSRRHRTGAGRRLCRLVRRGGGGVVPAAETRPGRARHPGAGAVRSPDRCRGRARRARGLGLAGRPRIGVGDRRRQGPGAHVGGQHRSGRPRRAGGGLPGTPHPGGRRGRGAGVAPPASV